jgi:excisionase family DNA binding protein
VLYSGRALERFDDPAALEQAVRRGRLRTTEEAAAYLGVRRSDLDHLVRVGRLTPAKWGRSRWQPRRAAPQVALYRTGDLDALAGHPAIDWAQVGATPRGRPSPLARRTTRR